MKILVTGHRGYIGSVLTPLLLERGHDVHGLDSDLFEHCTYAGELADVPEWQVDIRDFDTNALADERFDAIVHLAGLSNDPLGDYDPALTIEINTNASIRLAEAAKNAGVRRFLFASSCSNYGAAGDGFLAEDAAFNPVTPYGESKVNVEHSVGKLADAAFCPTFLRASTAYGASPRIRFDLVVNNLVAWAYTTGEIRMKSDGTPWRPLVHVEDIARAYVAVVEAEPAAVHNRAFNVGTTAENYRIRDVAELIRAIVPGTEVTFAPGAGPDLRNYRVDCNRIAQTLHEFKPQWTVRRGIEQLHGYFTAHGLELEDFEGVRFKRIAHVRGLVAAGDLAPDLRRVAKTAECGT